MNPSIIIETERLIIREHVLSDAPFFFELNSNYNVVKYTGDVAFNNLEEAENIVRYVMNQYKENGYVGLMKNQRSSYSGNFKQNVVEYMHENHLSCQETAIHFNLAGDYVVSKWERIYYEEGPQGLYIERRGRNKNMNSKPKKKKIDKEIITI